ncbi:N-acetyltaurine hydrolase-like [Asterias amurensis]|uniref:N-acetyltaurine hydrolase-like n=1 Tax=Asterias amurensis TaxID=7602 RepID=UPI003AB74226
MSDDLQGKILTVRGPIEPHELGCTMSHEHLYANFTCFYEKPKTQEGHRMAAFPITTVNNLHWLNQNPYSKLENMKLDDDDAIIEELHYLKENGCQSVVELTIHGLDRNVGKLIEYSEATDLHIVSGTGYYTADTHPPELDRMTQEDVELLFTSEILEGADGSAGRCGVLGELGCSWPIDANEKKVLRAAANVHSELGCPLTIHPAMHANGPDEAVRVLQEAGAKMENVVMDHLDVGYLSREEVLEFARHGTYLEFDFFGSEKGNCQFAEDVDFLNDAQRIQTIRHLVQEGFEDKILLSHDLHAKHQMMKYGGFGLSHIMLYVLPKMETRGLSKDVIKKFVETNPQTWLTFTK